MTRYRRQVRRALEEQARRWGPPIRARSVTVRRLDADGNPVGVAVELPGGSTFIGSTVDGEPSALAPRSPQP